MLYSTASSGGANDLPCHHIFAFAHTILSYNGSHHSADRLGVLCVCLFVVVLFTSGQVGKMSVEHSNGEKI